MYKHEFEGIPEARQKHQRRQSVDIRIEPWAWGRYEVEILLVQDLRKTAHVEAVEEL
jgi:hypothetical protein